MPATVRHRIFFPSCLLTKNTDIEVYGAIIVLVVWYGCETWSVTLQVLESRVLGKIYGPKGGM